MFDLSVPELITLALVCLPIVLLIGVMLKKMGYSDWTAIGLAILMLTPMNWLVFAYLIFGKWPIQEKLELLQREADDNATLEGIRPTTAGDKSNPLHAAIRKGYFDVVETLISQGVDTDATTAEGQTPLQLAIECEQGDIAELLRRQKVTS